MNTIKAKQGLMAPWLACALLLCFATSPVCAGDFPAVTAADDSVQSRQFEQVSTLPVMRACLAVLQDIKFQVTESELEPGLIVAQGRGGPFSHTLTISLQQQEQPARTRIRLTAATHGPRRVQPDYTDFYQDFFSQLQQELFQQRTLQ